MLVIKIVLTIILANILVVGIPFVISEIREFKNWTRLIVAILVNIMAALDIYILWFT